jgi:hypothetical protein
VESAACGCYDDVVAITGGAQYVGGAFVGIGSAVVIFVACADHVDHSSLETSPTTCAYAGGTCVVGGVCGTDMHAETDASCFAGATCCMPRDLDAGANNATDTGAIDRCTPPDGTYKTSYTVEDASTPMCGPIPDGRVTFDSADAGYEDAASYNLCCGYPSCSFGFTEDKSSCTFKGSCSGQGTAVSLGAYITITTTFQTSSGGISGTYESVSGTSLPPGMTMHRDCMYSVTYTKQ